ncbi:MAG: cytochrome P450 [Pseudonocardia sp.]
MSVQPTYDPFSPRGGGIGDRSTACEAMRGAGSLVQAEATAGGPVWIVTDDTLAREVLSDARFAKDPALAPSHWHGREPGLEPPAAQVRSLTTLDGPEHRVLRAVHAPAFTPRRILAAHDHVASIARDLLTDLAAEADRTGRPIDLVARFATRYPLIVICDLLGVPTIDLDRAIRASDAMSHGDANHAYAAMADLQVLVTSAIRAGRSGNDQTMTDILSERAHAELGDVTDDELLYMITGLIFAGQVTTESFLGFLLAHHLGGHLDGGGPGNAPGETAQAIDAMVSEALRLHPPAPFTLWRFTTTAISFAGHDLPAGAPVLVDIEGINTDPSRHPAPYDLDPHRVRVPDLTFGDGPHYCIGAQLARLEARVVIEVLRDDFPDAVLAIPFDELRRDDSGAQSRRLRTLPAWLRGPRPAASPGSPAPDEPVIP